VAAAGVAEVKKRPASRPAFIAAWAFAPLDQAFSFFFSAAVAILFVMYHCCAIE
jgi:hypothetical protein